MGFCRRERGWGSKNPLSGSKFYFWEGPASLVKCPCMPTVALGTCALVVFAVKVFWSFNLEDQKTFHWSWKTRKLSTAKTTNSNFEFKCMHKNEEWVGDTLWINFVVPNQATFIYVLQCTPRPNSIHFTETLW